MYTLKYKIIYMTDDSITEPFKVTPTKYT